MCILIYYFIYKFVYFSKKLTLFLRIQARGSCRADHALFLTIKLGNDPKTSCKSLGRTRQLCLHGGHCLKINFN